MASSDVRSFSPAGTLWKRRVDTKDINAIDPPVLNASAQSAHEKSSKKSPLGDRFIPTRSSMDMGVARFSLHFDPVKENGRCASPLAVVSPVKEGYQQKLAQKLLQESPGGSPANRILAFNVRPPSPTADHRTASPTLRESYQGLSDAACWEGPPRRKLRHIPQSSERILDAPELVDDYYLNLVDWSAHNCVAVALGAAVYLWDAPTGAIQLLMRAEEEHDYVTSVAWAPSGCHLAVGLNSCQVELWDVKRLRKVRTLQGHRGRVGSLAWNGHMLSTGGRDALILNHDARARESVVTRMSAHRQEICGLRWSRSGLHLASGANDNLLLVWDAAMASSSSGGSGGSSPSSSGGSLNGSPTGASRSTSSSRAGGPTRYLHRLDSHTAAVKAVAWCPFQSNLLASGGGTADRCIKFWNTTSGACLNSIDTQSQVCALQWSKHERELLSSHGYSHNQLCLWRYPTMTKLAELTGHSARVLNMAQSPDGYTVVSAAADETLRFWKVFGNPPEKKKAQQQGGLLSRSREGALMSSLSKRGASINIR